MTGESNCGSIVSAARSNLLFLGMDDCLLFPTELDQDRRNQGLSVRPHDEHFSVAGVVGISIRVDLYELTRCRTRWHESGIQESD